MRYKKWFFLLLITSVSFSALAQNDIQFWHAYNWKFFKAKNYNLNLYAENRIRDDVSESFGYFIGPTIRAQLNKTWSAGAAIKQIYLKSGDSHLSWQRTELEVSYKLQFNKLTFDHRNRHEYFFRDSGTDFSRYRSQLRFRLPLQGRLNSFSFSNEFFYDERTNDFATNRLIPVSLGIKLNKKLSLSTYYMWEHRRSGSQENHILGTTLSF